MAAWRQSNALRVFNDLERRLELGGAKRLPPFSESITLLDITAVYVALREYRHVTFNLRCSYQHQQQIVDTAPQSA